MLIFCFNEEKKKKKKEEKIEKEIKNPFFSMTKSSNKGSKVFGFNAYNSFFIWLFTMNDYFIKSGISAGIASFHH